MSATGRPEREYRSAKREGRLMTTVYELGPFRLDPRAGVLSQCGRPMALGLRAVAVLTALVRAPQRVRAQGEYPRCRVAGHRRRRRQPAGADPGNPPRTCASTRRRALGRDAAQARLSFRRPRHRNHRWSAIECSRRPPEYESSGVADVIHRPRTRARGDQAAIAQQTTVDRRWRRRHWQDPVRRCRRPPK